MGIDINSFLEGLITAFHPMNLLWILIGGFLGTVVGMLPGLGPATAVAVLIPVTFGMEPVSALILMVAIYYGAMYGGSRSSILLNTPGDGSAIAATFDGYPMTQNNQAGKALTISAVASLIGGLFAVFGFILLAQPLSTFALNFGPREYFVLFLFTLSMIVTLSLGKMVKGFIAMFIGLMISTVGVDLQTSVYRYTFDLTHLSEGIDFLVVIIGVYAVAEVFYNYMHLDALKPPSSHLGSMKLTKEDWRRTRWTMLRQSPIGFIIGVLPGAGGSVASLLSYSTEKQVSKNGNQFGKGAIEGVAAPEASNNAASVGSLIPLLTMGVPGSGTTAVILGAVIMLGLQPGPLLFENQPEMVWTLINSMFIGNIFLVIINIAMIGLLLKILKTPPKILYPIILVLAFLGTYTLGYSVVDFYILLLFGVIGLILKLLDFPLAPLILATIVGSDMEQNFRKSLITSHNNVLDIFLGSPIAIVLTVMTLLALCYPLLIKLFKKRTQYH
ncbi:tripartite tricarboxylate transporter permease [Staphylococcus agnetis]|uniref:tripartite tricarboxylate transporter permease n=1 Tax=Staphylococcus agnetis TaxID=985762 RepID=UPI000D1AD71D|nr:tripartite tricarboxylate transporter permease [Staphylococcus agnetis]MCO4340192.1 tripartite tricarboxylate transporter permease [Staphylococcus agnetis]MCO4343778.1 tripartite tricarboxylate transporter permease [Staphylococcus agnetis]MCO4345536.1 tripartite tricarboxylate transporter permease [Staphylococcus agnetis]MCO4347156.1 tripartite tricarboxylate transporter permease [Staphylococcus agnetis]MCO4349594.1 tripartite tricarboxylate transporter permease [Staphylococcus agnetis]